LRLRQSGKGRSIRIRVALQSPDARRNPTLGPAEKHRSCTGLRTSAADRGNLGIRGCRGFARLSLAEGRERCAEVLSARSYSLSDQSAFRVGSFAPRSRRDCRSTACHRLRFNRRIFARSACDGPRQKRGWSLSSQARLARACTHLDRRVAGPSAQSSQQIRAQ